MTDADQITIKRRICMGNLSLIKPDISLTIMMIVIMFFTFSFSLFAQENNSTITVGGKNINSYLPILEKTKKRMPTLDPQTWIYVYEAKPNLFFVTDGIYHSTFLKTTKGIIVFDAPLSYAAKLPGIIKKFIPNEPIKYLVYSHGHTDHIGGAHVFKNIPGLQVVAQQTVAENLKERRDTNVLLPHITYKKSYKIILGNDVIQFRNQGTYHSPDADAFIYLPNQKYLIAIDLMSAGYVPFRNLEVTPDVNRYIQVFDDALAYDFDLISAGHLGFLGNRQDVIETKEYVLDVKATVKEIISTISLGARIRTAFTAMKKYDNPYLALRYMTESVAKDAARQLIEKWKDKLAGVDVWAESHCETMLQYLSTH